MSHARQAPRILIVDDDRALVELVAMRLEANGYEVLQEHGAAAGLARVGRDRVDVVLLDLRLGDGDGMEVLTRMLQRSPQLPVIILTAHGSIETAVEAMRRGAYGFLTKPFHNHELLQKVAHGVESSNLRRQVAGLRRIVGGDDDGGIVGSSEAIERVRALIERLGPTDATVLVLGESGTGKELVARALHATSPRSERPFVAVNCAALPPDLLESTLFGHVRGAFTGATADREGLFGAAHRGTLFLDEIGEASPMVQARLLRVLQERSYTRVGSNKEEKADVRVITATNRDLRAEVAEKRFREDLFFRLHVVPIHVPPLRARGDDVAVLAGLFLDRIAARHGVPAPVLSPESLAALRDHPWPGNVRELANVIEAAVLLASDGVVRPDHLTLQSPAETDVAAARDSAVTAAVATAGLRDPTLPLPPLREAREAFERAYLEAVLERAQGNVTQAAKMAGRNRTDFYDLIGRHHLSPTDFKKD
jgi:two-component system response regulator GlrR